MRDEYAAYENVLDAETCPGRVAAGCLAHARRKSAELVKAHASPMAEEALRRIATYAYLRDVLERLPTHLASRVDDLLPHRWTARARAQMPCSWYATRA